MFRFLQKKRVIKVESSHETLLTRIGLIRSERAIRVFSPNLDIIRIRTPFQSIQEYNQFLRRINDRLSISKEINPQLFSNPLIEIELRDWFVDSNNNYLNLKSELEVFKERSTKLVQNYIKFEADNSNLQGKTLFHVGPVLNQIKDIVNCLIIATQYDVNHSNTNAIKNSELR